MFPISYVTPVHDIQFVLHDLLGAGGALQALAPASEITRPDIDGLMQELAEFAETTLAPLNTVGDQVGCSLNGAEVATPPGFKEAYSAFCERGWAGLTASEDHGGRALPTVVANLVTEIFGSANHSWLMYSSMSRGAYECIRANGTPEQQARYLPWLASGRWTGSMCITEEDAGTDVGLIKTRAVAAADGSYRLSGLKRMATNAEHDLSSNILHLVLARIEGAPAGSKGLSLFVVPKFLPGADGKELRNAVVCESLEDKMGIRGTPTCRMRFDGAAGELIGRPHLGLAAMFVMMNVARLGTGMQGVNQGERALQLSRAYARTRKQGRAANPGLNTGAQPDPLMVHADVRRMLLTQKAWVEGGRAFAYWIALLVDCAQAHATPEGRREATDLVALLTPVLKAFVTDNGYVCATLGQQVLGGVGYLRESGASQFIADVRVGQIYEGANGIQGMDLLGRKVLGDRGERLERMLALVESSCKAAEPVGVLAPMARATSELAVMLRDLTEVLLPRCDQDANTVGAAAASYLRLVGHLVHAWLWLRMAERSWQEAASSSFHRAKLATAQFYFDHLYPEVHHLLAVAKAPAGSVMGLPAEDF
ncbi:MAG: acyl-CoA dehydrogenase [Ottowia sp.]|uniref:acyl-CoA dehydrogenase n=1 Tax=Ottowia sp. TaxID=1898956 RepID=UPI003C76E3D2